MASGAQFAGFSTPLPGSPLAALHDYAAQALADGTIPVSCPHAGGVLHLDLPSRDFACAVCLPALRDRRAAAGEAFLCASCGAPGTGSTGWQDGAVFVLAVLCAHCQSAGNVPQSQN